MIVNTISVLVAMSLSANVLFVEQNSMIILLKNMTQMMIMISSSTFLIMHLISSMELMWLEPEIPE